MRTGRSLSGWETSVEFDIVAALDAVIVSCVVYCVLYPLLGKGSMGGQGDITLDEIEANLK